jgi:hypothetical protein
LVFLHSSAPLVAQNMQPEKCFFVNGKMKLWKLSFLVSLGGALIQVKRKGYWFALESCFVGQKWTINVSGGTLPPEAKPARQHFRNKFWPHFACPLTQFLAYMNFHKLKAHLIKMKQWMAVLASK